MWKVKFIELSFCDQHCNVWRRKITFLMIKIGKVIKLNSIRGSSRPFITFHVCYLFFRLNILLFSFLAHCNEFWIGRCYKWKEFLKGFVEFYSKILIPKNFINSNEHIKKNPFALEYPQQFPKHFKFLTKQFFFLLSSDLIFYTFRDAHLTPLRDFFFR